MLTAANHHTFIEKISIQATTARSEGGARVRVSNVTLTGINAGQVPCSALAAPLAKVSEAVLGEDHAGGDARVIANEAAVASTGLAIGAVRITARTAPRADTLMKCQWILRKALTMETGRLTRAWSSTPKLALWPGSNRLPKETERSGWPLGAFPTAGQTAVRRGGCEDVCTTAREM